MCDDAACKHGALFGGEGGSSTKYPSTEHVRIREYNRSIERHQLQTPCKPFLLTGLNTEARLILARAGKFETYLFNLTLSRALVLCTCALSCTIVVIRQVKMKRFTYLFSIS